MLGKFKDKNFQALFEETACELISEVRCIDETIACKKTEAELLLSAVVSGWQKEQCYSLIQKFWSTCAAIETRVSVSLCKTLLLILKFSRSIEV